MKGWNYASGSHKGDPGLPYTNNMKTRSRAGAIVIAGICLSLGFGSLAYTQTQSPIPNKVKPNTVKKDVIMTSHASGTFEVKLIPQAPDDKSEDATPGRMLIDKQFHGDIEGISKGQMLAAMAAVEGSGGYVAIERVSGTLQGRKGSFMLQHSSTMSRGVPQQSIIVVPDSGTDQLVGLAGKMTIKIADGKHFYDFEYTLAKTP